MVGGLRARGLPRRWLARAWRRLCRGLRVGKLLQFRYRDSCGRGGAKHAGSAAESAKPFIGALAEPVDREGAGDCRLEPLGGRAGLDVHCDLAVQHQVEVVARVTLLEERLERGVLHKLHGLRELGNDAADVVHVEVVELDPFEPLPNDPELCLRATVAVHFECLPHKVNVVLHLPDCGGDPPRGSRRPFGVRRCALPGIGHLAAGVADGVRRALALHGSNA